MTEKYGKVIRILHQNPDLYALFTLAVHNDWLPSRFIREVRQRLQGYGSLGVREVPCTSHEEARAVL